MISRASIVLLLILALTGCPGKDTAGGRTPGNAPPSAENAPVPVLAAPAVRRDIPIRLTAVGRVEAFETVSVKAQVGGQLNAVHFREGQEVRKGDLLFTLDDRPYQATLHREEANLARDEADARNADKEYARYSDLNLRKVVAAGEYDKAHAIAESKTAQVQADRASVEMARLQASYCKIVSPVDGVAGQLQAHAGNIVKANDSELVVVNRIRPVLVAFSVLEEQIGMIRKAMLAGPVPVSVSLPGREDSVASGTLVFINNQVDAKTGTILLKASFENADKSLWPGLYVNASVTPGVLPGALTVPAQAVQTGQSGPCVFVIQSDGGVENRPVVIGRSLDGLTVIESGLEPGEQVVTDGHLRLRPNSKVEVRRSLDSSPAP